MFCYTGQISLMPPPYSSADAGLSSASSTASSRSNPQYNGPLHFADSHSLPAPNQSPASVLPVPTFQSLAVGLPEHLSVSATVTATNQQEAATDAQSKAKGIFLFAIVVEHFYSAILELSIIRWRIMLNVINRWLFLKRITDLDSELSTQYFERI